MRGHIPLTIALAVIAATTPASAHSVWPANFGPIFDVGWMTLASVWILVFWVLAAIGAYAVVRRLIEWSHEPTSAAPRVETVNLPDDEVVRSDT